MSGPQQFAIQAFAFQVAALVERYDEECERMLRSWPAGAALAHAGDSLDQIQQCCTSLPALSVQAVDLLIAHAGLVQALPREGAAGGPAASAAFGQVLVRHRTAVRSLHAACLRLLRTEPGQACATATVCNPPPKLRPQRLLRVVLLEDNEAFARQLAGMLEPAGARVVLSGGEPGTVQAWLEARPDDWDMLLADAFLVATDPRRHVDWRWRRRRRDQHVVLLRDRAPGAPPGRGRVPAGAQAVFDRLLDLDKLLAFVRLHSLVLAGAEAPAGRGRDASRA